MRDCLIVRPTKIFHDIVQPIASAVYFIIGDKNCYRRLFGASEKACDNIPDLTGEITTGSEAIKFSRDIGGSKSTGI